jgi:hypothetical protein
MSNVTKLNTPLMIQAEFKILKADCISFTKRLGAYSDALQKLNACHAAQQVLEKAQEKKAQALQKARDRAAAIDTLGRDLSKFDNGLVKSRKAKRPLSK